MADQVGQHVDFGLVYQGAMAYAKVGIFVTESSGGGIVLAYVNRVYDQVLPGDVAWVTLGSADAAGAFYPGPGVFGVNTSNYTLESVLDASLL